ncbi:MAG: T9SS type A sorting domain-containing protein [Ignavibacteriales bacterium]|nr:T9SS type A sorting domain-containing protein [Ignavibacteriales bacterium]
MKQLTVVLVVVFLFFLDFNIGNSQGTIAFVDSFNQGNSNEWTWQTGSWTFADGILSTGTVAGHHFLIEPQYIFSNFTFQVDVMKIDDGDAEHPGLVFRWMNDTMNYVFRINGVGSQSWIQLARDMDNRDHNSQIISTVPWFTNENNNRMYKGVWYTMKVRTDSTQIKCKVWRTSDLEPSTWNLDVTDSQYALGKIGLEYYTGSHQYDNVVVIGEGNLVNDVSEEIHPSPVTFALAQNYPNPFNPSTTISYQLPTRSHVTLRVFDLLGREVAMLVNRIEESGDRSVTFDASRLLSGVYYYRLQARPTDGGQAGNFTSVKKLLLLK